MDEMADVAVDALLREHFAGPVPDGGFTYSVMLRLPARRRLASWPIIAGLLVGVAMGLISLGASSIAAVAWQDLYSGELSDSATALFLAMTSIAFLAMAWSITEAGDGDGPALRSILR